jgi:hypothetical protein
MIVESCSPGTASTDHALAAEWVDLYTVDGVMDFTYFDDADYFDDDMKSRTVDPATLDFPLKSGRFVGRDELYAGITTPRHKRIEGRCQHHMDGQPAMFRLVDDETAVIVSDSIVYARARGNFAPAVQYQNHALNRWTFRRVDGRWRIAENIRRPMGSDGAGELLSGF